MWRCSLRTFAILDAVQLQHAVRGRCPPHDAERLVQWHGKEDGDGLSSRRDRDKDGRSNAFAGRAYRMN